MKPDGIIIHDGILYVYREVKTLPDFPDEKIIILSVKLEEVRQIIKTILQEAK